MKTFLHFSSIQLHCLSTFACRPLFIEAILSNASLSRPTKWSFDPRKRARFLSRNTERPKALILFKSREIRPGNCLVPFFSIRKLVFRVSQSTNICKIRASRNNWQNCVILRFSGVMIFHKDNCKECPGIRMARRKLIIRMFSCCRR